MTSGAGATAIVTVAVSTRSARQLSCAWMVAVAVPAVVGVPEMTPVAASRERPPGSEPDVIVQFTVPIAPLTVGVSAYGTPVCALPPAGIVIENAGALIVTVSVAVAVLDGAAAS